MSSLKRGVAERLECRPFVVLRENTPKGSQRAKGPVVNVYNPKNNT